MTLTRKASPSNPELPQLSRYRVEALLECTAWEPGPGSPDANFGKAAHRALELWANDIAHATANIATDYSAVGISETQGFPVERTDELHRLVVHYINAREHPTADGWTVATEVQMTRTMDGVAVLSGIADRLDILGRTARVVDYKSGWSAVKEPEAAPFQVMFYLGLAAREVIAARSFIAEIHALQTGWVHRWEFSLDDVESWWQTMAERLADVLAAPMKPTGGPACRFCRHRWSCADAITNLAHLPATDAEAEEMVRETIRLDAAADERRKALREYLDKREAVTFAGMRLGYEMPKPSVRLTDKDRAVELGVAEQTQPTPRWSFKRAAS